MIETVKQAVLELAKTYPICKDVRFNVLADSLKLEDEPSAWMIIPIQNSETSRNGLNEVELIQLASRIYELLNPTTEEVRDTQALLPRLLLGKKAVFDGLSRLASELYMENFDIQTYNTISTWLVLVRGWFDKLLDCIGYKNASTYNEGNRRGVDDIEPEIALGINYIEQVKNTSNWINISEVEKVDTIIVLIKRHQEDLAPQSLNTELAKFYALYKTGDGRPDIVGENTQLAIARINELLCETVTLLEQVLRIIKNSYNKS